MQATRTTIVPWITCDWPGHSTFRSSAYDSLMKLPRLRSGSAAGWRAGWRALKRRSPSSARRAARRSERVSAIGSARLPVGRVRAAPAAVLAELHAIRRVSLRLHRLVVPPLALRAGERDRNSDSGLGHVSL